MMDGDCFLEAMSRHAGELDDAIDHCDPFEAVSLRLCLNHMRTALYDAHKLLRQFERQNARSKVC